MPSCVVKWCRSHTDMKNSGITFHGFPKNKTQRTKWVDAVRLERNESDWMPSECSKICSIHFRSNDIYMSNNGKLKRLRKTALPICTMVCSLLHANTEPSSNFYEPSSIKHATNKTVQEEYFNQLLIEVELEDKAGNISKPKLEHPNLSYIDESRRKTLNVPVRNSIVEYSNTTLIDVKLEDTDDIIPKRKLKECSNEMLIDIKLEQHTDENIPECKLEEYSNEMQIEVKLENTDKNIEEYPNEMQIDVKLEGTDENISKRKLDEYPNEMLFEVKVEDTDGNISERNLEDPDCSYLEEKQRKKIKCPSCQNNIYVPTDIFEEEATSPHSEEVKPSITTPISVSSPELESVLNTPRNQKLQKQITLQTTLAKKRQLKINNLQRKNKRLINKNVMLKEIIAKLKKQWV